MQTISVVSLNLWNRFGPWEARREGLRAGLEALRPDLVGVQELVVAPGFDQAAEICPSLGTSDDRRGYEVAFSPAHREGEAEVGNGLFSRFPIVAHETVVLPQGDDPHDRRVLLAARVETPFGLLPFFCTHLSWRLDQGHVRTKQVRAIADFIEAYAPSRDGLSPVLVGDFNAEPDADEMRFLRGLTGLGGRCVYFQDAFGTRGEGDGTTYSTRNPFAEPLREPDRRIDYVLVRGHDDPPRHGDVLSSRVCFDAAHEGTFPSDHFGVQATIRLR